MLGGKLSVTFQGRFSGHYFELTMYVGLYSENARTLRLLDLYGSYYFTKALTQIDIQACKEGGIVYKILVLNILDS